MPNQTDNHMPEATVRLTRSDDTRALTRLAALDSATVPRGRRRGRWLVAALAAGALFASADAARAGTLAVVPQPGGGKILFYQAAGNQDNDLEILPTVNGFVFHEQTEVITADASCGKPTPQTAACPSADVSEMVVDVGGGSNEVRVVADLPGSISGQGTKNVFIAGDEPTILSGGPGNDELHGGLADDKVVGNGGHDVIGGGGGDDNLHGGSGDDVFRADMGADQMDGGPDRDAVDYSARDKPVDVSLDGQANDGSPSGPASLPEGDQVAGTIETVHGGTADDTLTGTADPNLLLGNGGPDTIRGGGGPDQLFGGEGDDRVEGDAGNDTAVGGDGADTLVGGSGGDQVEGRAGDDSIDTRDDAVDTADCGEGTDTALTDAADGRLACELPAPPAVPNPAGSARTPAKPAAKAAGPAVAIGPSRIRLGRGGVVAVRVRCSRSAVRRCKGRLTLTPAGRREARQAGKARFSVAPGKVATVRVRLKRSLRVRAGRGPVRLVARASVADAGSATRTTDRTLTLTLRR